MTIKKKQNPLLQGDDTALLKTVSGRIPMILSGNTPLERLVRRIRRLEFKSFGAVQE